VGRTRSGIGVPRKRPWAVHFPSDLILELWCYGGFPAPILPTSAKLVFWTASRSAEGGG
jgi:hypothetical protein